MLYGHSILNDEHWPPPGYRPPAQLSLTFHLFNQSGGSVIPNP